MTEHLVQIAGLYLAQFIHRTDRPKPPRRRRPM